MSSLTSEIREAPLTPNLRDNIISRLNNLDDARAVVLAVDYDDGTDMARLAVYGNAGNGWSFAGWLGHEVKSNHTELGFEIKKVF